LPMNLAADAWLDGLSGESWVRRSGLDCALAGSCGRLEQVHVPSASQRAHTGHRPSAPRAPSSAEASQADAGCLTHSYTRPAKTRQIITDASRAPMAGWGETRAGPLRKSDRTRFRRSKDPQQRRQDVTSCGRIDLDRDSRPPTTGAASNEVLAFHDFPTGEVRWQEPCALHPPPCVHVHTATHATPWEWDRDRVLFDPATTSEIPR